MLDLEYLNKIESFMDSGDLAFEFENGDEDKRLLILEFLEKFMDVAEKADALATKLIFRDGYMELLSGNTDQK
ncbi:hypothetical protein M7784_09010 [Desulfovibrio aminophilus]|nr:hypothetical protein [Desulfovibrio aminophilus]MCM0755384.1 hypothetical protein [Desulfovibrio aminophilus]